MKVTLLMENNSLFGVYLNAEHGYSAWIEDGAVKVLMDCGFSDKFIKNAEALNIDLKTADYVILTHGHRDHTGGMKHLLKYYDEKAMYRKPTLIYAHEDIFCKKYNFKKNHSSGFDVDKNILEKYFNLVKSEEPMWLTDNLVFMGLTELTNDFEHIVPQIPKKFKNGEWIEDVVIEDTQVAYKHKNGKEVSVISACAHYGICNIMEYAKKITRTTQINTYLGGSHLRIDEVPQSQVDKTCAYVKSQNIKDFYICHDTDLHCKLALWNITPSKEAGVALKLELE